LFARPRHPYTRGLLDSIPKLGVARQDGGRGERRRLAEIAGTVPSLSEPIVGCAFAPRCGLATARCRADSPPLEEKASRHFAACWESDRIAGAADAIPGERSPMAVLRGIDDADRVPGSSAR